MAVSVAVVEGGPRLRETFARLVGSVADMTCVAACASGEEGLQRLGSDAPDVGLMDLNLPGISGIECTRLLKEARPAVQVVILTSFDDTDSIVASLAAGATGYVLKRASSVQILDAVREVHDGGSPMTGAIARKVVRLLAEAGAQPAAGPLAVDRATLTGLEALTVRERGVLTALSEGQQYKEVADTLGISNNTVRKHIKAIYEKLQVNTRLEAVKKAGGV